MDTPQIAVAEARRTSRPNITPKSATFGSPLAMQNAWTAPPRRRQLQQKAKSSFLSEEENDLPNPQDHCDSHSDPDSSSPILESQRNILVHQAQGEYNQSPTLHAIQAGNLPPQSAQPVLDSSMPDSPARSTAFEAVEKKAAPGTASKALSKNPKYAEPPRRKQKLALAMRGMSVVEDKTTIPARATALRPKTSVRKSLANSKIKLSSLEVEKGESGVHESHAFDFSIPPSNSNSPAATPAKKIPTAKKQPVKRPATKPKASKPKATTTSRTRTTKVAAFAPARQIPKTYQHDGGNKERNSLLEKCSLGNGDVEREIKPAVPEDEKSKSKIPATVKLEQDIIVISSAASESCHESDDMNMDDEDFECSQNVLPSKAGHNTRAAAQKAAKKDAHTKVSSQPAAVFVPRGIAPQTGNNGVISADKPKKQNQSKELTKPYAVNKIKAAARGGKAIAPSALQSAGVGTFGSTTQTKKKIRASGPTTSNATQSEKEKTNGPDHAHNAAKAPEDSHHDPNSDSFGLGGPQANIWLNKRAEEHNVPLQNETSALGPGGPILAATTAELRKAGQKTSTPQFKTAEGNGSSAKDFINAPSGAPSPAGLVGQRASHPVSPSSASSVGSGKSISKVGVEKLENACEVQNMDTFDNPVSDATEADMPGPTYGRKSECVMDFSGKPDQEQTRESLMKDKLARPQMYEHFNKQGEDDTRHPDVLSAAAPAVVRRILKRSLSNSTVVQKDASDDQSRVLPMLGPKPAVSNMTSDGPEHPLKKSRYDSVLTERCSHNANRVSGPVIKAGSHFRKKGAESGDDVFGPEKNGKPFRPSAFVKRLISNESVDRDPVRAKFAATGQVDAFAAHKQQPLLTNHIPDDRQFIAPEATQAPPTAQIPDDIRQRVLAALAPQETKEIGLKQSGDSPSRHVGERAWSSATEPYPNRLGETMQKIVHTILRSLKTKEAAVGDVVDDYRTDGSRVVERVANRHRKEREELRNQQEQSRLRYVQMYGEARRHNGMILGNLESVDFGKMLSSVEKDATAERFKRLQQAVADAWPLQKDG